MVGTEGDEERGGGVVAGEKGPKKPGSINGGFFPKTDDEAQRHTLVTIGVDDIKEQMDAVKMAGGKVFGEPIDIPGVGKYVSFEDTEGNRVTMLQSA